MDSGEKFLERHQVTSAHLKDRVGLSFQALLGLQIHQKINRGPNAHNLLYDNFSR
jgi:hypothetical protein